MSLLSHPHDFPIIGVSLRDGLPVSRDPATGDLWTLRPETATKVIPSLVRYVEADENAWRA